MFEFFASEKEVIEALSPFKTGEKVVFLRDYCSSSGVIKQGAVLSISKIYTCATIPSKIIMSRIKDYFIEECDFQYEFSIPLGSGKTMNIQCSGSEIMPYDAFECTEDTFEELEKYACRKTRRFALVKMRRNILFGIIAAFIVIAFLALLVGCGLAVSKIPSTIGVSDWKEIFVMVGLAFVLIIPLVLIGSRLYEFIEDIQAFFNYPHLKKKR